jgi:hypothetical protein
MEYDKYLDMMKTFYTDPKTPKTLGIWQIMEEGKKKFNEPPIINKCDNPKPKYCHVITSNCKLENIPPFIHKDDLEHKAYVDTKLKKK